MNSMSPGENNADENEFEKNNICWDFTIPTFSVNCECGKR
jgi:hypothetical protein